MELFSYFLLLGAQMREDFVFNILVLCYTWLLEPKKLNVIG